MTVSLLSGFYFLNHFLFCSLQYSLNSSLSRSGTGGQSFCYLRRLVITKKLRDLQHFARLQMGMCDAADHKDFPDMRFIQNTTSNIVLAGHSGYLLNGTFRDPTSDALQTPGCGQLGTLPVNTTAIAEIATI